MEDLDVLKTERIQAVADWSAGNVSRAEPSQRPYSARAGAMPATLQHGSPPLNVTDLLRTGVGDGEIIAGAVALYT